MSLSGSRRLVDQCPERYGRTRTRGLPSCPNADCEHMFTVEARYLCATAHRDLRVDDQPIDQIARHAAFDLRASDRDRHVAAAGCEEERRLACIAPSPDHRDRAVRARASLDLVGGVEDSRADELVPGHFTWEDAADEYAALVTSWLSGGYTTAGSAAAC
jgi:hypothetical protein